ncbi:hypothetical protein HK097_006749, partial [Rhizophlyctis rosea]
MSRGRSRSFSELEPPSDAEGERVDIAEPELERKLMELVVSDRFEGEDQAVAKEVQSEEVPPELILNPGGVARRRKEWEDPLKCEVAGTLVEPFMKEMNWWLDAVWKGTSVTKG